MKNISTKNGWDENLHDMADEDEYLKTPRKKPINLWSEKKKVYGSIIRQVF